MARGVLCMLLAAFMLFNAQHALVSCALTQEVREKIAKANEEGPYLGLIVPNDYELDPLLQNSDYIASENIIDFAGRRFRFGSIGDKPVILVMTGLGMINAAITTQLLLSFFQIEGVVHYGIAGNASPQSDNGDVTIPNYLGHLGLWSWQRYGQGPKDRLPMEENGIYTRTIGNLNFADFTSNVSADTSYDNLLNNIWYQREQIFPVDGTPEQWTTAFWSPVDRTYYNIATRLLNTIKLESCINDTTTSKCLDPKPVLKTVKYGASASIYLDNAAYRSFLRGKFIVTPVDMESASVALICRQQLVPFIVFRALSGFAGDADSTNEAKTFASIIVQNLVKVTVEFVKLLPSQSSKFSIV